jgi:hypothetical protein
MYDADDVQKKTINNAAFAAFEFLLWHALLHTLGSPGPDLRISQVLGVVGNLLVDTLQHFPSLDPMKQVVQNSRCLEGSH